MLDPIRVAAGGCALGKAAPLTGPNSADHRTPVDEGTEDTERDEPKSSDLIAVHGGGQSHHPCEVSTAGSHVYEAAPDQGNPLWTVRSGLYSRTAIVKTLETRILPWSFEGIFWGRPLVLGQSFTAVIAGASRES